MTPREIIAAAANKTRHVTWDGPATPIDYEIADAVLAALTDAGITLCRKREATPFAHAAYVPVEETP